MRGKPEVRQAFLEEVATWRDNLSVDILVDFINHEENPQFVLRALEILRATKHPKLQGIFEEILGHDITVVGLKCLDYLRELHGEDNLYPLDLVFSSTKGEDPDIQAAKQDFYQYVTSKGSNKVGHLRSRNAISIWKRACALNCADAFFLVGKCYEQGIGVTKDIAIANQSTAHFKI